MPISYGIVRSTSPVTSTAPSIRYDGCRSSTTVNPAPLERRPARRRQVEHTVRTDQPPLRPDVRVQQYRQIPPARPAGPPVEPHHVVEVAGAEHNRLKRVRRQGGRSRLPTSPSHVAPVSNRTRRAVPSISISASAERAVLGTQDVNTVAVGHDLMRRAWLSDRPRPPQTRCMSTGQPAAGADCASNFCRNCSTATGGLPDRPDRRHARRGGAGAPTQARARAARHCLDLPYVLRSQSKPVTVLVPLRARLPAWSTAST
jgi:hypothetical protein